LEVIQFVKKNCVPHGIAPTVPQNPTVFGVKQNNSVFRGVYLGLLILDILSAMIGGGCIVMA